MFSRITLLISAFLLGTPLLAQKIVSGVVLGKSPAANEGTLPGANVYWAGTTQGTVTDSLGAFKLAQSTDTAAQLVVSFVGFKSDTLAANEWQQQPVRIVLQEAELKEVVVEGANNRFNYSALEALNVQTIGREVLQKAACCTLSEAFETNATVDVSETDAVTGTRKMRLLGLDGPYSQIMFDNQTYIRGIGTNYGLDHIPGPWISEMQITKGTGSVVQGYESIGGQINLQFLTPEDSEMLYADLYVNHQQRTEANVIVRKQVAQGLATNMLVSAKLMDNPMDNNGDNFTDMPASREINLMNRWQYANEKFTAALSGQFFAANKEAGEMGLFHGGDAMAHDPYRTYYEAVFGEVRGRAGVLLGQDDQASIAFLGFARLHDLTAEAGVLRHEDQVHGGYAYSGQQRTLNGRLVYQQKFGQKHTIRAGSSLLLDEYTEQLNDSTFNRWEQVPGFFAEYTFDTEGTFIAIGGLRYDHHNLFGGQWSPRLHMKYMFGPLTALRFTAGSGFRSANPVAENPSVFVSSRVWRPALQTNFERGWNTGLSFLHKFTLNGREAYVNADYFQTRFTDMVVLDWDQDVNALYAYNLRNGSVAHGVQLEFGWELARRFNITLAGKYQRQDIDYRSGTAIAPLLPQYRSLANVSYFSRNKRWVFDATGNFFADARVPSTAANPESFQRPERSDAFVMVSGQITRLFKNLEVYTGVENLLNYSQPNPIIDAANPFGEFFDASLVWGPINGTVVYLGARLTLPNPK